MNRFTDDLPLNFDLSDEKSQKDWIEEAWPHSAISLPKCITQNAEKDANADYGLSLLKRASQFSNSGFAEAPFSPDETLKLIREAREFQETRILSPQKPKQEQQEARSPLRLKIIRKRSRKQSKTAKTDSTSEGRNEVQNWNLDSPANLLEQPHLHEVTEFHQVDKEGPTRHLQTQANSHENDFWQESQADYLGIERLIF